MKKIINIYIKSFSGLSIESWMLAIVMLLNRAGAMVLPFLGIYMIDHLRFEADESGFVLAFFGVGSVLGSWLGGLITDKIGEYPVQALSLFCSIPMFLIIPHFTSVNSLAVIIFIHATISELFRPANSVAVTKYAKPEAITRAFSLNRMAVNLGFSIGPALGGILSAISYDFLFYTNAIAAFVAGTVYVIFFRKRNKAFKLTQKNESDADKAYTLAKSKKELSPYLNRPFLLFCLFCMIFSICFFQLMNTLPQFYKIEVKLNQEMIGYLLGFSGIIIVLLEMLMIHLAEKRFTINMTMIIGTILCALAYGMLGFNHHLIVLFISMTCLSLGEIFVLPYMSTITAMAADKYNKGAYMGLNGIAVAVSFIISPILGTKIAKYFGFDALWICTGIILILAAFGFNYTIKLVLKKKKKE